MPWEAILVMLRAPRERTTNMVCRKVRYRHSNEMDEEEEECQVAKGFACW